MTRPSRICAEPGCPEYQPCPDHGVERTDDRPSASERGYGPKWSGYSKRYREEHPWCLHCERQGRKSPVAVVDHIKPVTGPTDPGFWTPANHQPLCLSCHAVKTASEGRTARHVVPAKPERRWGVA